MSTTVDFVVTLPDTEVEVAVTARVHPAYPATEYDDADPGGVEILKCVDTNEDLTKQFVSSPFLKERAELQVEIEMEAAYETAAEARREFWGV